MVPTVGVPTAAPTSQPTLNPTETHTQSLVPTFAPTTSLLPTAECPIAAPGATGAASCMKRSGNGFDAHQNSAFCPLGLVVCAGENEVREFADEDGVTTGSGLLFAGTISCTVVGTSDHVQIFVQEVEENIAYRFQVVGGTPYAITAVNLRAASEATFCNWWPKFAVSETGTLFTPDDNYVYQNLNHIDICHKIGVEWMHEGANNFLVVVVKCSDSIQRLLLQVRSSRIIIGH